MIFPNAFVGVKKIHTAVLLLIIAAALSAVAGILELIGDAAVLGGAVAVIAACVLMIIAFIMKIGGVNRASKDEPAFKKAMTLLIIGIAASIVTGAFSSSPVVSSLGSFVSNITEFVAGFFICTGIMNLADRLNDADVSAKAKQTRSVLVVIWAVCSVLSLLSVIFSGVSAFGIICPVVSIVADIIYLGLLGKAKNMLVK